MIVSKTPYRVSFAGGGTDLPAFCDREPGAVLSCTIDRHVYVAVNRRFERDWLIRGIETERVGSVGEIRHDLVREALKLAHVADPVEITMIGDVPAGTGLGSSGSLTVGLLNALHTYRGISKPSRATLADESSAIEIHKLRRPVGRQDQYAAALGGINFIVFERSGIKIHPVAVAERIVRDLEGHSLLFFTGKVRGAESILRDQAVTTKYRMDTYRKMAGLAASMRDILIAGDLKHFAAMLHRGWELKRSLGCGIATTTADAWYAVARKAGAWGGKLLGAGGGGFLLVMAPPEKHQAIRDALDHPRELPFRIDQQGSGIVMQ